MAEGNGTAAEGFRRKTDLKPVSERWFAVPLRAVSTPVGMGLLFFLVVTPIGLFFRLLGKNPLGLKRRPEAETYWILRDPPGPAKGGMNSQF